MKLLKHFKDQTDHVAKTQLVATQSLGAADLDMTNYN